MISEFERQTHRAYNFDNNYIKFNQSYKLKDFKLDRYFFSYIFQPVGMNMPN